METKQCQECNDIKPINDFYKRRKTCKTCISKINSNTNNAEKRSKKADYDKEYRKLNKDKISTQKSAWWIKHKETKVKSYKERNKERNSKRQNESCKIRRKKDPIFALCANLRTRLSKVITGGFKAGSAVRDLGCTPQEFMAHLESLFYPNPATGEVMSWGNRGVFGWHIDHIIPLAKFDLTNREELLKACHYTNLQPLWQEDHISKTIEDNKSLKV
jgi:hypothetical protein